MLRWRRRMMPSAPRLRDNKVGGTITTSLSDKVRESCRYSSSWPTYTAKHVNKNRILCRTTQTRRRDQFVVDTYLLSTNSGLLDFTAHAYSTDRIGTSQKEEESGGELHVSSGRFCLLRSWGEEKSGGGGEVFWSVFGKHIRKIIPQSTRALAEKDPGAIQ